ncbi:hypothetical protein DPMN_039743 [Dreissena polymorpha]|uniref:Uncharacterized protein n=1 Tax=Dreissena polymorpha TaxID=45954 RepID=A0A9D4CVI4_DREPO|nr:hypothetical protein DPMN_039743 [Dreissena polymorpha]
MFTTIFKLVRGIHITNVLTKFHDDKAKNVTSRETNVLTKLHEDWTKNVTSRKTAQTPAKIVTSRVFTRNTAPPLVAIFELSQGIFRTNVLTKFHEDRIRNVASRVFTRAIPKAHHEQCHDDWTINVTPRVLSSKTALPPGDHVFLPIQSIFKLNPFTCFHHIHIEKTGPPPGGHVFSPIWTIFELVRDINETNVLTKFHDDWAKLNTALPPGDHLHKDWESNVTSTVFTSFELSRGIIGTNVLTKFHEDRTINVASRVFTRQMLTTDARRTTDK